MQRGIVYVDRLAETVIDREGVTLEISSGDCSWHRRIEMGLWRKFIERETAKLAEFDRLQRGKVVPLRGKVRRH